MITINATGGWLACGALAIWGAVLFYLMYQAAKREQKQDSENKMGELQ